MEFLMHLKIFLDITVLESSEKQLKLTNDESIYGEFAHCWNMQLYCKTNSKYISQDFS